MSKLVISLARDYSKSPSGRYPDDGPYSGERFREEFLYPAIMRFDSVEVNLDGVLTLGSSFLEEAFGGLVRKKNLSVRQIQSRLIITGKINTFVNKAWSYILKQSR